MTSVGGALGGVIVSIIAPRWFLGWWEFHLGLIITSIFVAVAVMFYTKVELKSSWRYALFGVWILSLVPVSSFLWKHVEGTMAYDHKEEGDKSLIDVSRNFYGVVRIYEDDIGESDHTVKMYHGKINHGFQFVSEQMKYKKTAYYSPRSGVGISISKHPRRLEYYANENPNKKSDFRIGVIGLGAGTLAVYGQPGDYIRFYEINSDVLQMAQDHFSYLSHGSWEKDVVIGDARIQLEREAEAGEFGDFDIFAVDAFSGDAVPVHLLTKEAVELYWKHIKDDGILAFHISNRYFNLKPVVRGIAEELGYEVYMIKNDESDSYGIKSATWCIMTRNEVGMATLV